VKITPSILNLNFERTLQKVVPVKPRVRGEPAPGRVVEEVMSEPPEVRISGPRSRVEHVENAFTEPIPLEGATADVSGTVNVGLEDPMLRLLGSPRVKVTARLSEVHASRVFEGLPVAVRGGAAQARPAAVRVTVSGPAAALEKLQAADLRPYVTLDASALPHTRVALDLPKEAAGLKVASIDPPEISLRIPGKRNLTP
jgi:YbbR domain-containing protein